MAQVVGTDTRIITSVEDVYKTVPTLSAVKQGIVMPYQSESLDKKQNLVDSKVIKDSRDGRKPGRGNYETGGDIKTELNQAMYAIFAYALGSAASVDSLAASITVNAAGVGTAPYVHTFKVGTLPSFVVEKKFTSLGTPRFFQSTGSKVSKLDIELKSDGLVDISIGIMGADVIDSANSMSKLSTDQNGYDLAYPHTSWQSFEAIAADIKIGGAAFAGISTFSLSLENNLDGGSYVVGGAGARTSLPAGTVKVSGKVVAQFSDTIGANSAALITDALAGTERSIDITFTRGTGVGGIGNEKLRINIPEVLFGTAMPLISGPTGIMVELPFTAYYENNSDATTLMVVITNNYPPRY